MAKTAAERKREQRAREVLGIGPGRDTPLTATTVDAALLGAMARLSADPVAHTLADVIALASRSFAVPINAKHRSHAILRERRQRLERLERRDAKASEPEFANA